MNSENQNQGSGWTNFILLILILAIVAAGLKAPPGLNWLITGTAMFLFCVVLGLHSKGNPLGILINERNLMSLSRFQMLLWTIIILSAYFTMAMVRITKGIDDPLAIEIDWHLWALMGISTTSLVGTPMIYSVKKRKEPGQLEKELEKNAAAFKESTTEVDSNRQGLLYGNSNISDARFADLFEGDELDNTAYIDMSKVQMFFFTIIAALSYTVLLYSMITSKDLSNLDKFPALSEGLIAILAISHGGYLSFKNIDHTKVK